MPKVTWNCGWSAALMVLSLSWMTSSCMTWEAYGDEGEPCGMNGGCWEGFICCGDDKCRRSCTSGGDTGNGTTMPTWTDSTSGLTWQVTPPGNRMNWADAKSYCSKLNLEGGGWRLPNISELRSLIRNCRNIETGGACGVKDECSACGVSSSDVCLSYSPCFKMEVCNPSSCTNNGGPTGCYWPEGMEGRCDGYRSSSPVADYDSYAWHVYFLNGHVYYDVVGTGGYVRCVR